MIAALYSAFAPPEQPCLAAATHAAQESRVCVGGQR
jgi:hypothetical protein